MEILNNFNQILILVVIAGLFYTARLWFPILLITISGIGLAVFSGILFLGAWLIDGWFWLWRKIIKNRFAKF